ncbi:hypothetical protein UFOVP116_112 [uncultured Caudovirales phage]|uniref:Uncharacterized protein n=1 Tax=uncultured Caudovirales phage TaxID=2100421 RepID=A0A6J5L4T2_9CAUD|nr:hypothetical protein UFOVP116_112 [uncultured Caudovirales phage]
MFYYYEGIGVYTGTEFIPGFDKKASKLIPADKDLIQAVYKVCEDATKGIEANQYMMNCIARVGEQGMLGFYERIKTDKDINIVDCAVFMFCLERFTLCCLEDHTLTDALLEETAEIYSVKNLLVNMFRHKSLFVPVKAISVRKSVEVLQRQIKEKHADLNMCRITMKGNIIEAVIADFVKGRFTNASAGLILLFAYLPFFGKNKSNSYIDGEHRVDVQDNMDHWGDLYRVWNFAFVSNEFESCGFVGSKLFLPCVNGAKIDNEFRHNRVLSLYAMINLFTRGGEYKEYTQTQHRNAEFTRRLGLANLENALAYLIDLKTSN